jgi:hypothetical protein
MENRPKNMPRWEWEKSLEKEKEDLVYKKSLEVPQVKSNIIGTIIMTIVMLGFLYIGYLSLSGPAEDWSGVPDPCDGSNRIICP